MSDELRGLDRWIEREDRDGVAPVDVSPRWVWCRDCQRDDASVNQRTCRRCGSARLERHGGTPRRRRHYDE